MRPRDYGEGIIIYTQVFVDGESVARAVVRDGTKINRAHAVDVLQHALESDKAAVVLGAAMRTQPCSVCGTNSSINASEVLAALEREGYYTGGPGNETGDKDEDDRD